MRFMRAPSRRARWAANCWGLGKTGSCCSTARLSVSQPCAPNWLNSDLSRSDLTWRAAESSTWAKGDSDDFAKENHADVAMAPPGLVRDSFTTRVRNDLFDPKNGLDR